ncbi:hypothetical protein SAMN05421747_12239 [Parapedobacter composti]|uniref:Uncharacterized protein n=1 Tax=Parapedobacter composti TaxID=623281 RepID=A0A1I1LWH6_9SPHI|nr:DUF5689 domain-containing protein [Parapedobacter composti]SFC73830.1 hypothetical protein SAMN05421747_12239 [Parapedobacter composti]
MEVLFLCKTWGLKRLFWLILVVPVLMQCQEKSDIDLSLAVNSTELHLEAAEGKTHIMVYANGGWTARLSEEVDWVSINKLQGNGNSDIEFTYSKNFGAARRVSLILTKGNESIAVVIIQKGLESPFRFSKSKYIVSKNALPTTLPIVSDLKYDFKDVEIDYLYDDETSERWITNAAVTSEGVVFDALENDMGRTRAVRIYLRLVDGFDNEYLAHADIEQTVDAAFLTHKNRTESRLTKAPRIDTVLLAGNVGVHFPHFEKSVAYDHGAGWVEDVSLANDSLLILAVRGNDSGAERVAHVKLTLSVGGQRLVDFTHRISQTAEDHEYYSFEELREHITTASGELVLDAPLKVLEGIVVSDKDSPNMDTNPNLTFNTMNLTETHKTAYIQSLDGQYGFRLLFTHEEQNILTRYSKVAISLDGLTLVKEADPGRYTIKGLTSAHIEKNEPGTPGNVVNKVRSISELTDNDMYTFVTLRNTSISCQHGAYTNVNVGYTIRSNWNMQGATTPYTDAIPTSVFDEQGSSINMVVNTITPWSRNTLPKGSGTLSGIVVHIKLIRYGTGTGDIGRYAIRPVDEADIRLDQERLAKTLVEWNWMRNGSDVSAAGTISRDGAGNVLPVIGAGTLNCTVTGLNPSLGAHPVYHTNPNSKDVPASAIQYQARWWNVAEDKGEGLVVNFSTAGLSARSLLINFTQGGGSGSAATLNIPAYWEVEYSLDGANYSLLPNSTYCVRPLAGWGQNWTFAGIGLISHSFRLPDQLLNQPQVYVKLKAKNNICAEPGANTAETGRITSTTYNTPVNARFGMVAIQYIQ